MNLGLSLPADWRTRWGWLRSWMKDTTRERHKGPFIMTECTAGNYWRSWVAVETFKHNLWASMYTVRLLYHRGKAWLEWNVCCLSNVDPRLLGHRSILLTAIVEAGQEAGLSPDTFVSNYTEWMSLGFGRNLGDGKPTRWKVRKPRWESFSFPRSNSGFFFGLNYMMQWCKKKTSIQPA